MLRHRIPLVKKKSLRRNLLENGKLKEFQQTHKYNLASKYFRETATLVSDQPLQNYLDVSVWADSGPAPRTQPRGQRGESQGLGRRASALNP